jgi:hypothetical protein
MKFHSLTKYIIILPAILLIASCDKLDLKPTDTIDPERAYRNVSDLNQGVIGSYAALDYTLMANSATTSDEAVMPAENTVSNNDAYRWLYNSGSGSVTAAYFEYYRVIDRANRVLAAIDGINATGAEATLKERYKGEALALRAYAHFELLRGYASAYEMGALGVAYMKTAEIGSPARDPFESVIANIKADLIAAKPLIPVSFTEKSRITRNGIAAIQARVALYEKNWADAVTYSTEAINAVALATRAQFPGIWTDVNDSEVIWELKRNVSGTADGSLIGSFFYRQTGGIALYVPSNKLLSLFNNVSDVRYAPYFKFDASRGTNKSPYLINKYIGGAVSQPGLADIKLFRTGEMYLIRAEAKAESSAAFAEGAVDLNALRSNRITGYVNAVFSSKEELINAIYTERFKELAFEGHRFFDLKRRNLPIQRSTEDAVNTSGALTLLPTQAQYNYPLPAVEISVNKNAVQNPNY